MKQYDAVVVGSGPNGLAAALTMERAGRTVLVLEAGETIGGGCRTAELALPGCHHDIRTTSHPLTVSRLFRELETLIRWIESPVVMAHPFDDGSAAKVVRSISETAGSLGSDASAYKQLFSHFVDAGEQLVNELLAPFHVPRHPLSMGRFGRIAIRSAESVAKSRLESGHARALFAGMSAHSMLPLDQAGSAAAGLMLGTLAHLHGWPFAGGGSQMIVDALRSEIESLGGEIRTGVNVESMRDIPPAKAVLFDLAPVNMARIAGKELPERNRRSLARFRHGPGSFKIDYALDGPIPWRSMECGRAGVVHLGGTFEEIAAAERGVSRGQYPETPFVLVAQASLFDPTRAPAGKHTAWAYCHVPNGSTFDMTLRIENQIERFAPGFRDRVLAKSVMAPSDLVRYNANYIGGDIGGGSIDLRQRFMRPSVHWNPYSTPNPRLFLCSASTPPGGGVHGMCGHLEAKSALQRIL